MLWPEHTNSPEAQYLAEKYERDKVLPASTTPLEAYVHVLELALENTHFVRHYQASVQACGHYNCVEVKKAKKALKDAQKGAPHVGDPTANSRA